MIDFTVAELVKALAKYITDNPDAADKPVVVFDDQTEAAFQVTGTATEFIGEHESYPCFMIFTGKLTAVPGKDVPVEFDNHSQLQRINDLIAELTGNLGPIARLTFNMVDQELRILASPKEIKRGDAILPKNPKVELTDNPDPNERLAFNAASVREYLKHKTPNRKGIKPGQLTINMLGPKEHE